MKGSAWPEADLLFRQDPNWVGGDVAASVDLGGGRIMWLFGDSLIATTPGSRREAVMVHNSIGIQSGSDPSNARLELHWRDRPDAFFPGQGDGWLWPMSGVMAGSRLLVFAMTVRSTVGSGDPIEDWRRAGSLGFFDVTGWTCISIPNPQDAPDDWRLDRVATPDTADAVFGTAPLKVGGHLYTWGWDAQKRCLVARWSAQDAAAGSLEVPEFWNGSEWVPRSDAAASMLDGVQTEFTVTAPPLVLVQGFGGDGDSIEVRRAADPKERWGAASPIFRPTLDDPDAWFYACRAHPELRGADFIVTYCTIAPTAEATLGSESLYYPRFVRFSADPNRPLSPSRVRRSPRRGPSRTSVGAAGLGRMGSRRARGTGRRSG